MVSRFPFSVGLKRGLLHVAIPLLLVAGGSLVLYRLAVNRRRKAAAGPETVP
jgi:hypothetical protein